MKLNKSQRKAVNAKGGSYLVLAGAGVGKTSILTHRMAALVKSGVRPSSILLLTFTNKAANEMIERAENLIGDDTVLSGGTFHSFAAKTLRKYATNIGYTKNYSILSISDAKQILNVIYKEYPHLTGVIKMATIYNILSKIGNTDNSIRSILVDDYNGNYLRCIEDIKLIKAMFYTYKKKRDVMDFDDLLLNLRNLLRNCEDVRIKLSKRYQYIMVDEGQDLNIIQSHIVKLLSCVHNNVFMVGDCRQCWGGNGRVKTKKGRKKVKNLKRGDKVESIIRGEVKYESITHITKYKDTLLKITTESKHSFLVNPSHKCFTSEPEFNGGWYVYLMYRKDLGFRIGILSGGSSNTISSRTNSENCDRLWIIRKCKNEAIASYFENMYSLKYKIPKIPFKVYGRKIRLTVKYMKRIFKYYGDNGYALLKAKKYSFDHPNYVAQGTEQGNVKRININLIFNQRDGKPTKYHICVRAENKGMKKKALRFFNDYTKALSYAVELKKELLADIIVEKFRIPRYSKSGASRMLNVVPASQLTVSMQIPVVINNKIVLSKIVSIKKLKPSSVYGIEVASAGNLVANGIVSHNSIYKFRGADITNILNFPKLYPGCKILTVNQNYRSTPNILDLANEIAEKAKIEAGKESDKYKEKLFSTIDEGSKPYFYRPEDDTFQAIYICDTIQKYINEGAKPEHNAVLFRAGYMSTLIETRMKQIGMPFVKWGGMQFTEKGHVKDVVSLIKLVFFPQDPTGWIRSLDMIRGAGAVTIEKIINAVDKYGHSGLKKWKSTKIAPDIKRLYQYIKATKKIKKKRLSKVLDLATSYYDPFFQSRYGEDKTRIAEIDTLYDIAETYKSPKKFVLDLTLDNTEEKEDKGRVILSTVHSFKGLERPNIFIIDLIDGNFPFYKSIEANEVEEERRLFYVACTRAKQNLHLIAPFTDEEVEAKVLKLKTKDMTTRFITEIPKWESLFNIVKGEN